jgi:hypothetical protein
MGLSFGSVKDYSGMLNRIFVSTLVISLGLVALLRQQIAWMNALLGKIPGDSVKIPSIDIVVPLGTFIPAIVVAILCRGFRLHDVLSDAFRIRQTFDMEEILKPMALLTTGPLKRRQLEAISACREQLMNAAFYRYASSRAESTIDKHLIEMALDRWSWYWIVVEGACLAFLGSSVLLAAMKFTMASVLLLCVIAALWVLKGLRHYCSQHAREEVYAILSDSQRCSEVKGVFDAL